jgi:hypothetical protein
MEIIDSKDDRENLFAITRTLKMNITLCYVVKIYRHTNNIIFNKAC